MLDNYAEAYGVGRSYRRLYELRTHLGRFKLRADSLVRVTVDLKFLHEEGDGDSRQLWTKAEHGIYDECLMHIETLLTQSFLTINASFDMRFVTPSSRQSEIDCALSSAVNLFKTVVLAVHGDEAYDELLFDLLIAGADKVIDAILGHDHVTCHALNTLLHVAEHSLNEYDTTFRTGLTAFATPDIPGRVMRHFAARVEAALADLSENEIVLHWEHALDAYHSALEFVDTAAHCQHCGPSPTLWPITNTAAHRQHCSRLSTLWPQYHGPLPTSWHIALWPALGLLPTPWPIANIVAHRPQHGPSLTTWPISNTIHPITQVMILSPQRINPIASHRGTGWHTSLRNHTRA